MFWFSVDWRFYSLSITHYLELYSLHLCLFCSQQYPYSSFLLPWYNFVSKSVHNWVCDMILLLSFACSFYNKYSALTPFWNLFCLPWPTMFPATWTSSHTILLWVLISLCHLWVAEKMGYITNSIEQDNDVTLNYFWGFFFLVFLL